MPTSYGRSRSRSADGGCNVEGCPGAKRARASGTGYSHVLAHILRGEPSTDSREHTGIYGGPEPGTSGEALAPILCSGTHTVVHGAGAHVIPNPAPTLQSLTQCAVLAGQHAVRAARQPSSSQGVAAAAMVALQGSTREPTPPPLQLSPALPAPSVEVLVDTADNGEGEAEEFPLSSTTATSGKLT